MERITVKRKTLDKTVSFSYLPSGEQGLFLSGGLDSLTLLHWMSIDAPDLLKNLTLFTIKKESPVSAKKIAGHFNIKKHIFIEAGKTQGAAATAAILAHPEIKLFFAAITENPKVELKFEGEEAKRGEKPGKKVELPFVDLDKRYTVQLAIDLGAPIELSHTCTKLELDHCGVCFMCTERRWAFTELKINDPTRYTEVK